MDTNWAETVIVAILNPLGFIIVCLDKYNHLIFLVFWYNNGKNYSSAEGTNWEEVKWGYKSFRTSSRLRGRIKINQIFSEPGGPGALTWLSAHAQAAPSPTVDTRAEAGFSRTAIPVWNRRKISYCFNFGFELCWYESKWWVVLIKNIID